MGRGVVQGLSARPLLIVSVLALVVGVLGMHSLGGGHHAEGSTEQHVAMVEVVDTGPAAAMSPLDCTDDGCGAGLSDLAMICLAVLVGLALVLGVRRPVTTVPPPTRVAGPGASSCSSRRPRPPPLSLSQLCISRT